MSLMPENVAEKEQFQMINFPTGEKKSNIRMFHITDVISRSNLRILDKSKNVGVN